MPEIKQTIAIFAVWKQLTRIAFSLLLSVITLVLIVSTVQTGHTVAAGANANTALDMEKPEADGEGIPLNTSAFDVAETAEIQESTSISVEWNEICVNHRMEINGIGMGDGKNTFTNPQTLLLSNPSSVIWLQAQIAGRLNGGVLAPEIVTFTTDTPQTLLLTTPASLTNKGYSFVTNLTPTNQITAEIVDNDAYTPRALVLYAQRDTGDERWSSVGKISNAYVYGDGDVADIYTETMHFPTLTQATDLNVTAVVIDNNNDNRSMILSASAGDVQQAVVSATHEITHPSHGDLLNIINLELTDVPTGTNQVVIMLKSPPLPDGDSLVLVGLDVSFPCNKIELDADLSVNKASSLAQAVIDNPLTYTINVTNEGPAIATDIVLTDALPANVVAGPITPSQGDCNYGVNTATCTLGNLIPGNLVTITLVVTPTELGPANSIVNTVVVTSATPDAKKANNTSAIEIPIYTPSYKVFLPIIFRSLNLKVSKTSLPDTATYGLPLTYIVSVTNDELVTATDVILTDYLPVGIEAKSIATVNPGPKCSGTNIITCTLGNLAHNDTVKIKISTIPKVEDITIINTAIAANPAANVGSNIGVDSTFVNRCIKVPNNSIPQASAHNSGPLIPGITYCGRLDDADDYYFIDLPVSSHISITQWNPVVIPKDNYPAATLLALYKSDGTQIDHNNCSCEGNIEKDKKWCCRKRQNVLSLITTSVQDPGRYYIRVWADDKPDMRYWLQVNFKTPSYASSKSSQSSDYGSMLMATTPSNLHMSRSPALPISIIGFLILVVSFIFVRFNRV